MTALVIAQATYKTALHAVRSWHYSATLPPPKRLMLGVWEDGTYIGVVVFSRGASATLGSRYGLAQNQVCELTRVALREHRAPVSQIVSAALAKLRQSAPGIRLVVSFADPAHGHHGGIYQAGNWIYTGRSASGQSFRVHGRVRHARSMAGKQFGAGRRSRRSLTYLREYVDPAAETVITPGKHRYVYPLDRAMRRQIRSIALSYPAAEASTATRPAPGGERQVRPLPAALPAESL